MKPRENGGWLDLGARVAGRLLKSPRFRRDAEIVRDHVDPDEAPGLVRTLMWTDPGLSLSLVAAAPAVLNAGIESLREVVVQLEGMPRPAIKEFLDDTVPRVRARALGEAAGRSLLLAARIDHRCGLWREFGRGFADAVSGASGELREHVVSRLDEAAGDLERTVRDNPDTVLEICEDLDRLVRRHPDLVEQLVRPLHLTFWDAVEAAESVGRVKEPKATDPTTESEH